MLDRTHRLAQRAGPMPLIAFVALVLALALLVLGSQGAHRALAAPAAPDPGGAEASEAVAGQDATSVGRDGRLPRARGNSYAVMEDRTLSVKPRGVLKNDEDNNRLVAKFVLGVEFGRLNLDPDGSFTYRPRDNFYGTDYFKYRACEKANPGRCSAAATVKLTVKPVEENPIARRDDFKTKKGTAKSVAGPGLLRNDSDSDGDPLKVISYTQPRHGGVTCYSNGGFYFRPDRGFTGKTGFRYVVGDGFGGRDSGYVQMTVYRGR